VQTEIRSAVGGSLGRFLSNPMVLVRVFSQFASSGGCGSEIKSETAAARELSSESAIASRLTQLRFSQLGTQIRGR
jgi:hypothetical protein